MGTNFTQCVLGTKDKSGTFLANGEVAPRLHEGSTHIVICPCSHDIGDIDYITVVCDASKQMKRFYLSSIHVRHIYSTEPQQVSKTKTKLVYFVCYVTR